MNNPHPSSLISHPSSKIFAGPRGSNLLSPLYQSDKIMFRNFIEGFTSYGRAWDYIRDLRLWGYLLVPALISVVLAIGVGSAAWALSDNIGGLLTGWIPGDAKAIDTLGRIFGGLLVGAVALAIFKVLVIALCAPFMSPLSEKIEAHITGRPAKGGFQPARIIREMLRGLGINLRNLFWELFLTLLLVILGLVIPILAPLTPVLIFLVQAYYAGFGNMDFTLERHFSYRDSILFVRDFKGLAMGNGTAYLLLLFTGIGFLVALPLGVIASTIETVERIK